MVPVTVMLVALRHCRSPVLDPRLHHHVDPHEAASCHPRDAWDVVIRWAQKAQARHSAQCLAAPACMPITTDMFLSPFIAAVACIAAWPGTGGELHVVLASIGGSQHQQRRAGHARSFDVEADLVWLALAQASALARGDCLLWQPAELSTRPCLPQNASTQGTPTVHAPNAK